MKIALYTGLALVVLIGGFLVWFFVFFLSVPKLNIPANASETKRLQLIDEWFAELQVQNKFNGTVLLAKDGKALLAKGYGYTNHKKDERLTAYSSLRLASVSKQFTAAGIMLLKEQGKLNFDDFVVQYIKDFPYKGVTIRHLLNQTSGVPDIYMELAEKNEADIEVLTNQLAVDLLIKENRAPDAAPNEQYAYSNTNYILLARLIEVITGLSFEDFMKQELFNPLEMHNTRVWNLKSAEATFENKADDFRNFKGATKGLTPSFLDGVAGDGAVFSSALDLLKWDQFWYENKLLSPENLKEAFKEPTLNDGTKSDYGFGWVVTEEGPWHNGAWLGANTMIWRDTKTKTCVAILDNSSNLCFDEIVNELRKYY